MKLLIIGVGDCGCRLASEFAQLSKLAKTKRHANIVTRVYQINTDQDILTELTKTGQGQLESVLLRGSFEEEGSKSNEAGARVMRQESDRVMTAMRLGGFFEADAFLLIAGAAGSLGSGGVPIIARQLKERYADKPIYALIVLPFDAESADPQCIQNTATCLKSIDRMADAVILVDNEELRTGGNITPIEDMDSVNKEIVFPFYDLLCAGEIAVAGSIGAKALDTGDIVQALAGWTTIGIGKTESSEARFLWKKMRDFKEKGSEMLRTVEAMNLALSHLSVNCKLEDAGKAMYLLSIPVKEANIDMSKSLGNRLRELAPNAEIRSGNFYGVKGFAQVTVVISELIYVDRIKSYYERAVAPTRAPAAKSKAKEKKRD